MKSPYRVGVSGSRTFDLVDWGTHVPELITALEARPRTQIEKNLTKAITTVADSEPIDLRTDRDTFVDLFADGSLNIRGEVMLVDLLTQLSSTVDIGYRQQ